MIQVNYKITDEGLVFTADNETRKEIKEAFDSFMHYESLAATVLEYPLCNGLFWVEAHEISALTSSLIFSDSCKNEDDDTYPEDANFYWYSNYAIEDPIQILKNTGRVVFEEGK